MYIFTWLQNVRDKADINIRHIIIIVIVIITVTIIVIIVVIIVILEIGSERGSTCTLVHVILHFVICFTQLFLSVVPTSRKSCGF